MTTTMLEPSPEATRAGAGREKRIVGRLAGTSARSIFARCSRRRPTFTQYLGRLRVEKAKTLLLNPHLLSAPI
jgi:hypothetical protein